MPGTGVLRLDKAILLINLVCLDVSDYLEEGKGMFSYKVTLARHDYGVQSAVPVLYGQYI